MRFPVDERQLERFRYAQALLGHAIPSGDAGAIYSLGIEAIISECEKRKFGATAKPPAGDPRRGNGKRHIPAAVRREVWRRDQGRCTHVAPSGHRCGTRGLLEFDHATPIARGGTSAPANLRLRCRAHNQAEAKRVLGGRFMNEQRRKAAMARTVASALPAP